jgi:hypothetical protein
VRDFLPLEYRPLLARSYLAGWFSRIGLGFSSDWFGELLSLSSAARCFLWLRCYFGNGLIFLLQGRHSRFVAGTIYGAILDKFFLK